MSGGFPTTSLYARRRIVLSTSIRSLLARGANASVSPRRKQKLYANKIKPIRKNGHLLLVTLLLANMIVNETLPVISDPVLGGGFQSVVVSTVLIVMYVLSPYPGRSIPFTRSRCVMCFMTRHRLFGRVPVLNTRHDHVMRGARPRIAAAMLPCVRISTACIRDIACTFVVV